MHLHYTTWYTTRDVKITKKGEVTTRRENIKKARDKSQCDPTHNKGSPKVSSQ